MFNVKLLAIPFLIFSIATIILCVIEIRKYKNPSIVHQEYRAATKEMIEFPNGIRRQRMYKKMKQTFQLLNDSQKQKNNIHNLIEQTIRDCIIKKGGCEDSLMIFSDISQSEEGFVVKVLFRGVDGLALDLVQDIAWEFEVEAEDMVITSTRVPHEIVLQFLVKEKEGVTRK